MEEWFNAVPGWQGAKSMAEYEKTRKLEPEDAGEGGPMNIKVIIILAMFLSTLCQHHEHTSNTLYY